MALGFLWMSKRKGGLHGPPFYPRMVFRSISHGLSRFGKWGEPSTLSDGQPTTYCGAASYPNPTTLQPKGTM